MVNVGKNKTRARNLYSNHFPNRITPSKNNFPCVQRKLRTGYLPGGNNLVHRQNTTQMVDNVVNTLTVCNMNTDQLLLTDRDQVRNAWGKSKHDVFKDVGIIREWSSTQKHLPEIPTDNMIEFFLTNCKFSIEKTKQNLDMYYTVRDLIPEIYRNCNPCLAEMEAAYNTAYYIPLPKLTPELHRICLAKYKGLDTDIRRVASRALNNIYEIRIHEDLAIGEVYIVDCENVPFGAVATTTPMLLKQCAFILEKVTSLRVKSMHIYKPPAFFHTVISLFKTFLSKKLKGRIYIHQSLEEMAAYFPLEILPRDYGGQEKSLDELEALWKQKLFEYKERFDKLDKMKVNEALRPEKLKNDELLGYYGNFKNIDMD